MKMVAALHAGILRLLGFESAITRMDITFENQLSVGERVGVDRAALDHAYGAALHCTGNADFIAAHRQNGVVEASAREQCAGGRHAKAH